MTAIKKPVNVLFLVSIATLAITFFVFNFLIYQKEKEKARLQTARGREALEKKQAEKNNQNDNIEPVPAGS